MMLVFCRFHVFFMYKSDIFRNLGAEGLHPPSARMLKRVIVGLGVIIG